MPARRGGDGDGAVRCAPGVCVCVCVCVCVLGVCNRACMRRDKRVCVLCCLVDVWLLAAVCACVCVSVVVVCVAVCVGARSPGLWGSAMHGDAPPAAAFNVAQKLGDETVGLDQYAIKKVRRGALREARA